MLDNHFYHETIKRSVSVFGTLFNNLTIKRDGGKLMKVPLAYGPRSKWIAKLQQTNYTHFYTDIASTRLNRPRGQFRENPV